MSAKNKTVRLLCQLMEGLASSGLGGPGNGPFLLLVKGHSFCDGISMDSQGFGGFGDVRLVATEGPLNVNLFKFVKGFRQKYMAVQHFIDQSFKASSHVFEP